MAADSATASRTSYSAVAGSDLTGLVVGVDVSVESLSLVGELLHQVAVVVGHADVGDSVRSKHHGVDPLLAEALAGQVETVLEVGAGSADQAGDEPTTGLHPADVDLLMRQLHKLVETGSRTAPYLAHVLTGT